MKETLKKSWWQVTIYCAVAGWISYWLEIYIGSRFLMTKLPDGTITTNDTLWMVMSAIIFLATLAVGGFLFFRRMSKRELFCSASVMVIFNIAGNLIAHFFQRSIPSFTIFYAEISTWKGFIDQLLYDIGLNQWLSVIITGIVPYLFVLFGKRETDGPA